MTDPSTLVASQPLPASAWAILEDQRILRITGPGTDKFLQGQFSQNLEDVTPSFSPRAAASTPKGRAYCLTRMVRDGDDVLLALPEDLTDHITSQLRKYLMLFRGTSMEVVDNGRILGILGDGLPRQLGEDIASQLNTPGDSVVVGQHHLIRTQDTADKLPRFELWQLGDLSPAQAEAFESSEQTNQVNWQASEIAAGIARLTPSSLEAYVPQMLNWQHVQGVHFKKGCYTGQEVIARMHFLGQLKKSLFRFSGAGVDTAPECGTAIRVGDKTVGEVVNSVRLADTSVQCLAVVRHNAVAGPLHLDNHPDITLERLPLPYSVPEQQQSDTTDT
ncbi:glycine cleavage T-protein (aminomethyl transferase) [Marinobacter lipolyticus SM19]|uniref:Glycine cleavage T-protein (Aminomethyl transferase) n=1 Tax=Marinobacter lipolyticus SM19 TaxID=1318628 RepID=R8AYP7_9GAMM|nr:folate-binding protein YgfZ [Marinobacter lipolyticus]EON91466.1 glycine cleavage T-protein (aminomethyl transferase) [Marinobacter lipolyticus SM19]